MTPGENCRLFWSWLTVSPRIKSPERMNLAAIFVLLRSLPLPRSTLGWRSSVAVVVLKGFYAILTPVGTVVIVVVGTGWKRRLGWYSALLYGTRYSVTRMSGFFSFNLFDTFLSKVASRAIIRNKPLPKLN